MIGGGWHRGAARLAVAAIALVALGRAGALRAQPAADDRPADVDDTLPGDDAGAIDPGLAGDLDAGAGDPGAAGDLDAGVIDPAAGGARPDAGAPIIDAAPPVDALPPPSIDPLLFGQPEVSAAASPTSVKLGEPITLVVTAVYEKDVAVNLPDPLILGPAFEVGRREVSEKKRTDGKKVKEWQVRVFAWEVGDLQIPPVQVTFTAGGRAAAVVTNPVPIRVVGVLGDVDDPKAMRDMTPPVPLWSRDWFWLLVGGGVVIVLALIIGWLIARRRRKPAPVTAAGAPVVVARPRRKLDALATATLAKLDELERSGRIDREPKACYAEMIAIVRDYLGARFGFDADEMTSAELRRAVAARSDLASDGAVVRWLAGCDLVRYAGRDASADDARATLGDSRVLVLTTTPGGRAELEPAPPVTEAAGE